MQIRSIFVAACLLAAAKLSAQYAVADPPLNVRWSLSVGPSTATSSGRTLRLPEAGSCFSCPRTTEVVSGADKGSFHGVLSATGAPGSLGLALRLEVMFNRNTSAPYVSPPPTCAGLACDLPRKSEVDDAWALVGGIDYSPFDAWKVAPYVALGGGISVNLLKWRQDSSTTSSLNGDAVAFGPLAHVAAGARATFGRWAAFMEWRQVTTFVTPGSKMTPLSFGVQYRPKRAPVEGT